MRYGFAAALALVALAACDKRVAQCNQLIDAINEEQPKLAKTLGQGRTKEPTPEALGDFAEALDGLVGKLKKIELKDPKLVGYRDAYAKLAEGLAAAARKTAANFEDHQKATEAANELNSFGGPEKDLVKQINDYCQGRS